MIGQRWMNNAFDRSRLNAFFCGRLEVNDVVDCFFQRSLRRRWVVVHCPKSIGHSVIAALDRYGKCHVQERQRHTNSHDLSSIQLSLSNGLTATVDPLMLTATASCGKTPTLTVTASPGKGTLFDKTILSTSQCSATLSSPASTTIGSAVCGVQNLICQLAEILNSGATGDPVDVLNQLLTKLTMTLG